MSFLFISHASVDKVNHIRPIIEVFLAEGEDIWVDRPGVGMSNLGFSQQFISDHRIEQIQAGTGYVSSIQQALRESGAVVGCLSRAMLTQRDVLLNELAVASTLGKLVACIIDDLEFSELFEMTGGLLDAGTIQAPRIHTSALQQAIELVRDQQVPVDDLPQELWVEWDKVRSLIASADRVRSTPRGLRPADISAITPILRRISIGPILRIDEIPSDLIYTLGAYAGDATKSASLINQANELLKVSDADSPILDKMLVRLGSLPSPGTIGGDAFWTSAFCHAGLIARRTVAALILAPVSTWAFRKNQTKDIADSFINTLLEQKRE